MRYNFHKGVVLPWKSGGCRETSEKSVGYRLVTTRAELPEAVEAGGSFTGTNTLRHVGWGKIDTRRDCERVFRKMGRKKELVSKLSKDGRRWCPSDASAAIHAQAGADS